RLSWTVIAQKTRVSSSAREPGDLPAFPILAHRELVRGREVRHLHRLGVPLERLTREALREVPEEHRLGEGARVLEVGARLPFAAARVDEGVPVVHVGN